MLLADNPVIIDFGFSQFLDKVEGKRLCIDRVAAFRYPRMLIPRRPDVRPTGDFTPVNSPRADNISELASMNSSTSWSDKPKDPIWSSQVLSCLASLDSNELCSPTCTTATTGYFDEGWYRRWVTASRAARKNKKKAVLFTRRDPLQLDDHHKRYDDEKQDKRLSRKHHHYQYMTDMSRVRLERLV